MFTFDIGSAKMTLKKGGGAMKEITNKPVPRQYEERFEEVTRGEEVLFIVVGDLDLKGKYADSMLVFTKNGLIAFDRSFDGGVCSIAYNEMESADVKRLYGNALFRVRFSNGKRKPLMRFSYAAAEVADAGAVFVNSLKEHGYSDEDAEVVKSVYLKQRSFCPKCGRKLPSPDAECLNCSGKRKLITKFSGYVKPETKPLIVCMILSVLTTAFSLVPPYITKIMVDDVIPQKSSKRLMAVILLLLGVYVLQYVINGFRAHKLRISGDRIVLNLKKDIYMKRRSICR